jgi:hypothetical protein
MTLRKGGNRKNIEKVTGKQTQVKERRQSTITGKLVMTT